MARIDHAAPYFMPLFCSNRSSIVAILVCIIVSIFVLIYAISYLLPTEYDDPNMFTPNAQDYFRTSLLGFLSPFLFYFLKTFIFNINPKFLLINLFFDFPLNDSFLLCILIGLAYPQLQDQIHRPQTDNVIDPIEPAPPLWHIIPRQSYIFGLNWALAELILSILDNMPYYKEIKLNSTLGNSLDPNIIPDNDYINTPESEESLLNRNNITLSRCVGLRRISSTISSNVYSSDLDVLPNRNSNINYGTIGSERMHSNKHKSTARDRNGDRSRSTSISENIASVQVEPDSDSVLIIDPKDNSIRLTSLDLEHEMFNNNNFKPKFNRKNGFVWVTFNDETKSIKKTTTASHDLENNNSSSDTINRSLIERQNRIRYYCEIQNNRYLIVRYFRAYLIFMGNILLTIGESFILSIYFIYIRGHENLFTDVVNYFGSHSLLNFFLCVIIPFLAIDYIVNILILFWNDMENVYGTNSAHGRNDNAGHTNRQNNALYQTEHFYFDLYSRALDSENVPRPQNALMADYFTPESQINSQPNYLNDPSLLGLSTISLPESNKNNKRRLLRKLMHLWQRVGVKSAYIVGAQFLWGLTVFVVGIYTAADI
ncbi:similar to Saccharomyces cerevisiae YDL180W Putative protein of unknown function [Maudiozyma barnettii]|uniref:Uncharacterized protein n=1 Tax=Maudiozyma barnettii TaxID=61262 RepID=A0A8H2VEA4_9SACH|nr:hypothetical protein [Kazachstania barnettii]CAB4253991.1 similar to Saccharomyces cerevisiae YDL180W Putative protein of unknown function [Kazachstania barnettii]CAD1781741.1 similar to Saccharomyces cerevisiae YDL180W Putative protein of unknown function [Kazachstania barnettii]